MRITDSIPLFEDFDTPTESDSRQLFDIELDRLVFGLHHLEDDLFFGPQAELELEIVQRQLESFLTRDDALLGLR